MPVALGFGVPASAGFPTRFDSGSLLMPLSAGCVAQVDLRIDLFLKTSRLCPRRAVAQQLCDAGFVLINGKPAKSAHVVKHDDEISIRRGDRQLTVRVTSVPAARQVSREGAREMYQVVSDI
jgi:ribosomal 50S subunit-recycling heat shock protein